MSKTTEGSKPDFRVRYVGKIVGRFTNPFINDEIPRVARGPLRKLGPKDRFISPATQYYDFVEGQPVNLAKGIAAALKYDFPQDDEAVALQAKVNELGYEKTIHEVCGLEEGHPLVALIIEELKEL